MKDSIDINFQRLMSAVQKIESDTFSTADLLKNYNGGFHSNKNTPPTDSFNAQFGKVLKSNASRLGIQEVLKQQPIIDDNGHKTTASFWEKTKS